MQKFIKDTYIHIVMGLYIRESGMSIYVYIQWVHVYMVCFLDFSIQLLISIHQARGPTSSIFFHSGILCRHPLHMCTSFILRDRAILPYIRKDYILKAEYFKFWVFRNKFFQLKNLGFGLNLIFLSKKLWSETTDSEISQFWAIRIIIKIKNVLKSSNFR